MKLRYGNASEKSNNNVPEIENEPFIGMWRNRDDMDDSRDWLRNLRINGVNILIYIIIVDTDFSTHADKLLCKYRLSHGLLIPDALIVATASITRFFSTSSFRKFIIFSKGDFKFAHSKLPN